MQQTTMQILICILAVFSIFISETSCLGKGDPFSHSNSIPLVETNSGTISGKIIHIHDADISAFFGIPFAEPPVGDLRFKKPVPKSKWKGVLKALEKPSPCMQFKTRDFPWVPTSEPNEDCLYLNIWVPEACSIAGCIKRTNLPVLFWIYGGGYSFGSTDMELYDGSTIATYGDVIVVSANYRVGSFGFFNSGTSDASGNMGLYDQNLALRWVNENIKNFGGDPNKITLFGESVGSVSVGFHMISPLSRNLFRRVILQSGTPFHPLFDKDLVGTVAKGNFFASVIGCANNEINLITNPEEVLRCMRKKDAMEIAKVEGTILQKLPFLFIPTTGDEFLPENPIDAISSGDIKQTEVLMGNNRDEGSLFLHYFMPEVFTAGNAPDLDKATATMIIKSLFQNTTVVPPEKVAEFYLSNVASDDVVGIREAIYNSYGDFTFLCPSVFFAEKMKSGPYYYLFTHRPSNTPWGEWMGTTHFDDVAFVFGVPVRNSASYTAEEGRFSCNVIQKWTSFARSGLPIESSKADAWPKYSASNPVYLELNPKNNQIGYGLHTEACNFWREHFARKS